MQEKDTEWERGQELKEMMNILLIHSTIVQRVKRKTVKNSFTLHRSATLKWSCCCFLLSFLFIDFVLFFLDHRLFFLELVWYTCANSLTLSPINILFYVSLCAVVVFICDTVRWFVIKPFGPLIFAYETLTTFYIHYFFFRDAVVVCLFFLPYYYYFFGKR